MKIRGLFICLAITLFCSCVSDPIIDSMNEGNQLIPLNIAGSIKQVSTKATATGFVDKDAVGLFAVNYLENNTVAGTLALEGNQADNVKYIFDESNQKWNPVRPVYYKNINTNVDLYLYYPFRGEISDINASYFEVQKDQSSLATSTTLCGYEASDWMWGKAEQVTPTESKVQITLSHRLSAVQLTLGEGTGFESGEFSSIEKSVILSGTTRKATLDFSTGGATPIGTPQLDGIVMCPQSDGSYRAVVIPQEFAAGGILFAITVNGVTYQFSQNEQIVFQQGKQINYTINVNKKTPTGEYELELANSQIVDWSEDLNTHGGEARQYYVVNVETPGTLGQLIKSAGKNPDKIRNLKVTGTVMNTDFFFMRDSMAILTAVNMKESQIENNRIPSRAFYHKASLTYFVFPEYLEGIDDSAFRESNISGHLVLPDGLKYVGHYAFYDTQISRVSFPSSVETLGEYSFANNSSLTGDLLLPDSLRNIYQAAFRGADFQGVLHLPDNLEFLGAGAFYSAGSFTGDLSIPEKITSLESGVFHFTQFTGRLYLNNVTEFKDNLYYAFGGQFEACYFSGELIIPEGFTDVFGFSFNNFTAVYFPSTVKTIDGFFQNERLEVVDLNKEGLIRIEDQAFASEYGNKILKLEFPSTLQSIGSGAFRNCFNISSIISHSIEPPTIHNEAFDGVGKDNFTVEVPAQSLNQYKSVAGWKDFKRISAHYDFSLSRSIMRTLNDECSRSFVLRAPSGQSWSIQDKPDWVSIVPDHGEGKTDVTVTVASMQRTNETFEVNEGTYNNPLFKDYKGRTGDVIFKLNDKDYTFSLKIEQFDSDYVDGDVTTLNTATKGSGIDIVFIGDGYDAKDIANGFFSQNASDGYTHFFDVEPYKSYKEYFNVYSVMCMSPEHGVGTENTVIDNKFGSYSAKGILLRNPDACFAWAKKADSSMDLSKSLVILLDNTSSYEGTSFLYNDGSAIACCPVSTEEYPYDFRGIIQHEAGGVSFGKLAKEYILHNAFIDACPICVSYEKLLNMKSLGWARNLELTGDMAQVGWTHLIYHPDYSDYVDVYEGGYFHSRGVFRSEATSCMNNNIPYFSAISRQAIVERIMDYAGETFTLQSFYENDDNSFGPITKAGTYHIDRTFGVDPRFIRASSEGPVFMGEHPNVK